MSKPCIVRIDHGELMWWCLGCERAHRVPVEGDRKWTWNGDLQAPTLTPSVLVYPHKGLPVDQPRCHIVMTAGMVYFLSDCTHALAGEMLPLPQLEDDV